jgi:hypothetical protein
MTRKTAGKKRAKKARENHPGQATDVMESMLLDPRFDEMDDRELGDFRGRTDNNE